MQATVSGNQFDISGAWSTIRVPDGVNPDGSTKYKLIQRPGVLVHSFNRWLGINMTGVPSDGNTGADGRIQPYGNDQSNPFGVLIAGATIEKTLTEVYNRVSKVAKEFYGKKYLVPLPFTPPEIGQHLRQISDEAYQFETSWEPASSGWVDINLKSPELGKRYPQNINFFDQSGKLQAFAVYPREYVQIVSKDMKEIYFPGAGLPPALDTASFHVTTNHPSNSLGGGSEGKVFTKATVDSQIYWLWNPSMHHIQTGEATTGTLKPYALITVNSPATYGGADISRQAVINTGIPGGMPVNSFWSKNLGYMSGPGGAKSYRFQDKIIIPLGKVDDGRWLFKADANHPRQGMSSFQVGDNDGEGAGRFTLAATFFKPWTAAVPMESNRYRWGPWAEGRGFGKAKLVIDQNFNPENFGGYDRMEQVAIARVQAGVEPLDPINGWSIESGSISLAGLPSKDDVGNPRVMGLQLMDTGPYVTDLNVSIGDNGVTTSYNMKMQRKPHKLNEIYENRIRQSTEDYLSVSRDLASLYESQFDL